MTGTRPNRSHTKLKGATHERYTIDHTLPFILFIQLYAKLLAVLKYGLFRKTYFNTSHNA
jgi:hypothetical protein